MQDRSYVYKGENRRVLLENVRMDTNQEKTNRTDEIGRCAVRLEQKRKSAYDATDSVIKECLGKDTLPAQWRQ